VLGNERIIRHLDLGPAIYNLSVTVIESVPNVSEGRRPDVLAGLAEAVQRVPGTLLLDHSADPSHNRSVFTIAGDAGALQTSLLRLVEIAVARIDLRSHQGVHPRLGAVDVVPFVPLGETTMAECIELSRSVGRAIADTFAIPVYLYEESATRPGRRRLEQIRRGQFEGLEQKMAQREWTPDFGPAAPHPTAGATVVGARRPLVAYNVNLDSDDLALARGIAAAVRESSGGLPCVKALGLSLAHRGVVQVSMNLTDITRTPVRAAFEAVRREAQACGVRVLEAELVGLIPAAALKDTTPAEVGLAGFQRSQILEERIADRLEGR
jgi:glutamate formiminotransferase